MNSPRVFYGWWIVAATVAGLMVCNGPVIYSMTVFIPPLIDEFGWGRGDISLALTFHLLANAIVMPIAGTLVDRFGARRVLTPTILAWGLGIALISIIPGSLWALYAIFFILGIITSGATPLPYGRAISAWFNRRRGLAIGVGMSGTGLGTLLLPVLSQQLIEGFGWRLAFAGIGALIFAVGVFIVIPLFRDTPEESGLTADNLPVDQQLDSNLQITPPGVTAKAALRMREFWIMAFAFPAVAMTVIGTAAHMVPMLVDRGITPGNAVINISVMGFTLLLARVWAGYLLDRYFAPYVAIGFICGPIVGCLLLAGGAAGPLAVVAAIGIGLGIGAEVDFIAYLISRYFGLKSFGVLYGIFFGTFLVGGSVGPPLMGYGYDLWSSYIFVLYFFAAVTLIACILLATLGPYQSATVDSGI